MITLRPAKPEDAPRIWRLIDAHKHTYLDDYLSVTPAFVLEVITAGEVVVLSDDYGDAVGVVWWADRLDDLHVTAHLLIEPNQWLAVWRGKVLDEVIDRQLQQVRKIKALPMLSQKHAAKLLERLGFQYRGKLWNETKRKGRPIDVKIYELTLQHWRKIKGR